MSATTSLAATDAGARPRRRGGLIRVAASIAVLNVLINAMTVVSGPLQARALGPAGRGELAAILVPLAAAPVIADIGLSTFVLTAVAKGRPVAAVLGSIGPIALAAGIAVALAGPFLAGFVAGGRHTVALFLTIGFALMPVALAMNLLLSVTWARERWHVWILVRVIPPAGMLAGTIVLYALGTLTVTSVAIVVQALAFLAAIPVIATVRWEGGLRFERRLAAEGLRFGVRAWLFGLATMANARLDQLVMTRAVSSQQLGLYSVSVNVSGFQQSLSSGAGSAMFPRVSAGDGGLTARACRVTIWLVGAISVVLLAAVGILIPLLFGEAFSGAVGMTRILLLSTVASAGTVVLATGLTASGLPGVSAAGEVLSLGITIPGLILLLGPLGGTGAAIVSLAAYVVTFLYLLTCSVRRLGGSYHEYVIPRRDDWAFVLSRAPVVRAMEQLGRLRLRLTGRDARPPG
jgi:O-antigen/teichoic acid export membrane protein